jgi:GntR family transcriptional regulator
VIIHIDPQSPEPIFEQIAFAVKGAVARGEAGEGQQLPSVRELARELTINPNTVVRAYDSLERDGVILRRKGAGCFLTGRGSELDPARRRTQLDALMLRAATEAHLLGFGQDQIRASLAQNLQSLHFPTETVDHP